MGIEVFEEVASQAWAKSEKGFFPDSLHADIWIGQRSARKFVRQAYRWVDEEMAFRSQTSHPDDDAEKAERAIGKITKELQKNPNARKIKVSLTGFDIVALEKIMPDPKGDASFDEIARSTEARAFLNHILDVYIKDPDKYLPQKQGFVRRAITAVRKSFQTKTKW